MPPRSQFRVKVVPFPLLCQWSNYMLGCLALRLVPRDPPVFPSLFQPNNVKADEMVRVRWTAQTRCDTLNTNHKEVGKWSMIICLIPTCPIEHNEPPLLE